MIKSLHIIGSRQLGGAESFFLRFVSSLKKRPDHDPKVLLRSGSALGGLMKDTFDPFFVPLRNNYDLSSILKIRRIIRQSGVDVVQTYMGRGTRLTRVPKDCNALHVARLGGFYKIDGYYRHADAWVGNTRGICDYLVRQGLPSEKVFYIGNFVRVPEKISADQFSQLRTRLSIPQDALVIFSLGRFIEKKGFADLISAFSQLPSETGGRPLYLLLGGDGPLNHKLREQVSELGLNDRVRWIGWVEKPEPYFQISDLFVCPSRIEPLGNVILEAWAHSLPVVSTATAGALELIDNDHDGLIVTCENPRALSEVCQEVLFQGDSVMGSLAEQGFKKLQRGHSEDTVVSSYTNLYRELLKG